MSAKARNHQQQNVCQSNEQRKPQHFGSAFSGSGMHVHSSSLEAPHALGKMTDVKLGPITMLVSNMETAEVAIIGGGIVASSIAYHLTAAGCKNVLVIERESAQGKGSTGKSMGGVRAQFSTPVNIQMSLYSIPFYARFEETLGHPSGYRDQGYLFAATKDSHLAYLRSNFERQQALGLKTARMLEAGEIVRMLPQLRSDDIVGGSFCSTDGFVDPYSAMTGFMARATEQGATLWKKTDVTGITCETTGNGCAIRGVETSRGTVDTRVVVNAAGAWAAQAAKFAGVDLPVEPLRRMLVPSEPFDDFPHSSPMVIDMSNGFHFRPEGRGFLLAWNDREETPGFKTNFENSFIEKILIHAADRVPAFENLPINPKRAWAGLYEMTPDHHCILGPAPQLPGFFFSNGFSGHGVMHAPSTGKIISDLVLH